jgi:transposase
MKKEHVKLSNQDREQLQEMLRKGSLKLKTYKRISSLLALDEGLTYESVSKRTNVSTRTLERLVKRHATRGLACLYDKSRPGRPVQLDQASEDQIVLLSCSDAPEGYSQWSLRLLADKMVELGHSDEISHTQVAKVLKKRKSNPI